LQEPTDDWLEATVTSGRGEASKYLSDQYYTDYFLYRFYIEPYPGTLNLKLSSPVSWDGHHTIPGDEGHGEVWVLPCIIARKPADVEYVSALAIRPLRTAHPDDVV
jgi:CTP-dependent riboflavin kinase